VRGNTLERFARSGFSYVSLTVGQDSIPSIEATILHMPAERKRIVGAPDEYVFVEAVDDILHAKAEGKLALGVDSYAFFVKQKLFNNVVFLRVIV